MIETTNVYYSAFLLTEGFSIGGVEVQKSGHGPTVVFRFIGQDATVEAQHGEAYREERAVTNIRKYLDNLTIVRDLMHSLMQRHEREAAANQRTERTRNIPEGIRHGRTAQAIR